MGIYFSCPLAAYNDLESGFESIIVKSINFGDDKAKTPVRSISFKVQDSKPTTMQSIGSRKMVTEESVSFRTREIEIMSSIKAPLSNETNAFTKPISTQSKEVANGSPRSDSVTDKIPRLPIFYSSNPKHEAAIKLQKVYKSFRTRRKLADCAVLIEQSWWKLLDYAELKRSSISFFELEKNETAISRWSRARTRAAKVGKGLSKNGKAQKLALQHWLEAIDPRHRYGHNLHFYYVKWLHSQSKEPFFYWLDIGEGKEVNLVEKCSRSKLLLQCIKYLGPMERKAYKVVVEDGKLLFKQTRVLLDTTGEPKGDKWIFVLSTSGILYVGKKRKGSFQHSSFLAGGATLAAGRIVVEKGILKAVWPHSGHYRPTPENFQDFVSFLRENNVDITDVKMDSVDEEEESLVKQSSSHMRSNSSDEDFISKDRLETEEIDVEEFDMKTNSTEEETTAANFEQPQPMVSHSHSFSKKLTNLQIPKRVDLLKSVKNEKPDVESPLDGYETAEESFASEKNYDEEPVPEESILRRINSHKGMKSYQLGKQLSCKWSTGAGPRIGCVRDYPSGLQSHALERVNLSPRSAHCVHSNSSPRVLTPTGFNREMQVAISPLPHRSSILHFRAQSSPLCKVASVDAIGKPS